jgi:TolB-like protein/Tfp pilus assembly protein PilF
MIYRFDKCKLDTERLELRRDGELQAVEPQVFSLLVHLIENHEHVVSKDDLIDAVWDGRIVSDATLSSRISAARTAVGDTGKDQAVIKTMPRRGFRFVGQIESGEGPATNGSGDATAAGTAPLSPPDDRPSVAVLPFANRSGDTADDFFADGIAEDITTELSRFSSLFVVSRMSAFDYRGNSVSESQIGSDLGVAYVLNGSVQRSGERLRVSVALTDTRTENQVWAERYDRAVRDIFDVQDEISETVASTLVGRLQKLGTARVQAKKSDNLSAYEYLLRGLDLHKSGTITPERAQLAYAAFTDATEEDPGFARAHAWRACSYSRTWGVPANAAEIQLCLDYITTALELDSDEAESHRIAGALYRFLRDYEKSDYHIEKSLQLNPNDAHITIKAAEHACFMDRPDQAHELAARAMRLNPHFPDWYWEDVGLADYVAGNFNGAADSFRKVQAPTYAGFAYWAAAAQEAGDHEGAAQLVERMRDAYPDISLAVFRDGAQHNCFRNPQVLERFIQGLSGAGLD